MERGAEVTLITGQTAIEKPPFVKVIPVVSAADMFEAVKKNYTDMDYIVKAAAVADYTPEHVAADKMKKSDADMSVSLVRTVDILKYIGEHRKPGQVICGFAMETKDLLENATRKLTTKNVDMIAANNLKVAGAGFGTDTNVITLIKKDETKELPILSKEEAAKVILDEMIELSQNR